MFFSCISIIIERIPKNGFRKINYNMDNNSPDFETSTRRFKILEVIGLVKPFAVMILSCLAGMYLLYLANTEIASFILQIILYFIGCVLISPSLVLFYVLYGSLLKPKIPVNLVDQNENAETNHETI